MFSVLADYIISICCCFPSQEITLSWYVVVFLQEITKSHAVVFPQEIILFNHAIIFITFPYIISISCCFPSQKIVFFQSTYVFPPRRLLSPFSVVSPLRRLHYLDMLLFSFRRLDCQFFVVSPLRRLHQRLQREYGNPISGNRKSIHRLPRSVVISISW